MRLTRIRWSVRSQKIIAGSVALALAAAGIAAVVSAESGGHRTPAARPAAAVLSPAAAAMKRAIASGKPVTVTADTTEVTKTVARPDGTFASTTYALPVRVREDGAWRPVSAGLRKTSSGRWRPAAVPSGLTLSGGGTGPLATLTSLVGGEISVYFPAALPTPAVRGATATYRSVEPGADLLATATKTGGLALVLILHSAGAARSPLLRTLRLRVVASGLKLASQHDDLTAVATHGGGTEFLASAPLAWDSAISAHTAKPATGATAHAGPGTVASGPSGPGTGARAARVPYALTGSGTSTSLALHPAPITAARDTVYPAYLAASITPAILTPPRAAPSPAGNSSGIGTTAYVRPAAAATFKDTTNSAQNGFDELQQGCPNTVNWDNTSLPYGNGVGYDDYSGGCDGLYRSLYKFDTSNLASNMKIQKATLYIWENYGSDWTCTDTWKLTAHLMKPFGSTTDWANQPAIGSNDQPQTQQVNPGPNPNSACPEQTIDFNVDYAMQLAETDGWSNTPFGFYGDETVSSTNYGFMRLGDNPKITTVYDLVPPVPTIVGTVPASRDAPDGSAISCASSTPYPWVGLLGKKDLTLQANVAPALTDENTKGYFHMWDTSPNIAGDLSGFPKNTDPVAGPYTATLPDGVTLTDGHQYGWNAESYVDGNGNDTTGDGINGRSTGYTSAKSYYCYFNTDFTPPTAPVVTSSSFPPSGSNPGTSQYSGSNGDFTFTATDPGPGTSSNPCANGPCTASGVYEFEYSLNTPIPASGASIAKPSSTTNGTATATLSSLKVGDWGTNILYVDSVDTAGNRSPVTAYSFYVPWNNATPIVPGDITNDGIPDLLATTSGGDLLVYSGNTDPAALDLTAPANSDIAGTPATSPDGSGWNTFRVTHRGSLSQNNVDDLFAQKGSNLYLYRNNPLSIGAAPQFADGNVSVLAKPACQTTTDNTTNCGTYHAGDWSDVSQILAVGDAWNPTSTGGLTSLLTVENDQLWVYQSQYGYPALTKPVLLGSSGWSGMTLIAPGRVGGVRTLWARDNATGAIYSYPITVHNGAPNLDSSTPDFASPGTPVTATSGATISCPALPAVSYPSVVSPGPLDNSGYPGLYAQDTAGEIWYYPGQSTSGGASPLAGTRILVGNTAGFLTTPAVQWPLSEATSSGSTTNSSTGIQPATATGTNGGTVTWVPYTLPGSSTPTEVADFSPDADIHSSNTIDTSGSFTVTAWVKVADTGTTETAVSVDSNECSSFQLQEYNGNWTFTRPETNTANPTMKRAQSATTADTNWTFLAATYDASSGTMTLYVNGTSVATATDTTPYNATGDFIIGRGQFNGSLDSYWNGEISTVTAYGYALSASQISAMYASYTTPTQQFG